MGIGALTRRAVFLDRDGVVNENWFNPATGAWESPLRPADFHFCTGAIDALRSLRTEGFLLFLVSNQPSWAKGKCTKQDLARVHEHLVRELGANRIEFSAFYYSYRHPEAVVPELGPPCFDRKPNPYYLNLAVDSFALDRARCWMIGDRETDVECGKAAGVHSIRVSTDGTVTSMAERIAPDLAAAVRFVLEKTVKSR